MLFGTSGVARGLGPDGLSSTFVGAWRAVIGGAALVAGCAIAGSRPTGRMWSSRWTWAGGAAVIGYQLAFFAAADRVGVGPAAVVAIGTGPVVAGVLDRVVSGTAPSPRWAAGVSVAVAGIVALSAGSDGDTSAIGWLFAVLAGSCYPVYGLAAQRLMRDHGTIVSIATVFGAGAALALPVALGVTLGAPVGVPLRSSATILLVVYLGVVATAIAYALWAVGLRRLTLSDTVAVTLAEPVAAVALAALLLDEPLTNRSVVAMAVVVGGVAVATR